MDFKTKKKITAVMLAGAMTVTLFATSCGKQDLDYNLEDNQDSANIDNGDSGSLAERLGVPESCNQKLDLGNSNLDEIEINDDDIIVPDTDSMSIVYYEKNVMDSTYKQNVTEAIFDKSKGIYLLDWGNLYKDDIDLMIAFYQNLAEKVAADGYTDNLSDYQETISYYENMYQDAPVERPDAGDYSDTAYIGFPIRQDVRRYIRFYPSESNIGSWFTTYFYTDVDMISYRPYEGAESVYIGEQEIDGDTKSNNTCSISQEEAVILAQDFFSACEINDVVLTDTADLAWTYTDCYGKSTTEVDGYVFTFYRGVDGIPVYGVYYGMLDWIINGSMEFDYYFETCYEKFILYVDDNGVLFATCYEMLKPTGDIESNVELLSWSEILEAANSEISEYYTEYATSYKSVSFNDVRLTYFLVFDEEKNIYKYIPVWIFAETGDMGDEYPSQLIVLNAVTGELIDLQMVFENMDVIYED